MYMSQDSLLRQSLVITLVNLWVQHEVRISSETEWLLTAHKGSPHGVSQNEGFCEP